MPTHASACPLDCPDACSLDVTVEDGRVRKIAGNTRNPITDGYICAKVSHFEQHMYCPERLLSPAVRAGRKGEGRFAPVSWDEALERVSQKLLEVRERSGGEAILPFYYGGSNGMFTQEGADVRLFRRLGASRLLRTVCAAPTGRAAMGLYGKMAGVAFPDYVHARLIVVWGANPSASGIHLVPYIQEAQRRGAKLVVVDPRRTQLARRADLHLALRPGTDLPLALATLRWLFENGRADDDFLADHATGAQELRRRAAEWTPRRAAAESGVPADQIECLARLYADTTPALIRCGWGQERSRNGGAATAAVLALPAVAGKFGVRGGGYTLSQSAVWGLNAEAAIAEPAPATRAVNMNHLGEALQGRDGGRVDLLFVYNCNPLQTMPAQEKVRAGLCRDDLFTVVFDAVLTDTARYADVVLPATTFLEHAEMSRGYGSLILFRTEPVAAPVGQARSNYDVFAELCRRTGVARPGDPQTPDELASAWFTERDGDGRIRRELQAGAAAAPECGTAPVQFVDVFPNTPNRKVHLCPEELDAEAPGGLYHYLPDPATTAAPLALISPASGKTISSTFGQLIRRQVPIEIHPDDAAARGIRDGDAVRVYNSLGEVRCRARVTDEVRPGVASLPKGLWSQHTLNGATANALVPDTLSDLGGGACFNDARVQVAAVES